jgi:glycosyltransferase involved in cell wall biosynthesis
MKLIIQIPCLNESESLAASLAALPREIDGFDCVEVMVIDDGSTDRTVDVARALGVDHILQMNGHQGLARAFMAGLVAATELGADVIVNIDADNQYSASCIGGLVRPIIEGRADIVIGARPLWSIRHFSPVKRLLQTLGSRVVRTFSGTDVCDATSGFRAMNRHAALRLNVFDDFTYTIETIIQAGASNLRILSVAVQVNGPVRPSRLFRSNLYYVWRSVLTVASVYTIYRPTQIFGVMSLAFLLPALALGLRYLLLMTAGEGSGHVHSLIACSILAVGGVFMAVIGIVAHLQKINRRLLEELRYLLRSERLEKSHGTFPERGDGVAGRLRGRQLLRQVPFQEPRLLGPGR